MKILKITDFKKVIVAVTMMLGATFVSAQSSTTTTTSTADNSSDDTFHRGEFGIRYMPTFSALDFNSYGGGVVTGSATMSHGFGIMLGFNFGKHVGLQGEINYYDLNQKYVDRSLTHEVDVKYVNVPLMLSFNTNKAMPINFNVVVGPQLGINVGSSVGTTGVESGDTLSVVAKVKTGDVGLAYGAGLEFAVNPSHTIRFDLGFRGYYGLVDMDGNKTGTDTYNVIIKSARKTYGGYLGIAFLF